MPHIIILTDRCKGCGLCVDFCPKASLHLSSKLNAKGLRTVEQCNGATCTACTLCAVMCPDMAIEVYK